MNGLVEYDVNKCHSSDCVLAVLHFSCLSASSSYSLSGWWHALKLGGHVHWLMGTVCCCQLLVTNIHTHTKQPACTACTLMTGKTFKKLKSYKLVKVKVYLSYTSTSLTEYVCIMELSQSHVYFHMCAA